MADVWHEGRPGPIEESIQEYMRWWSQKFDVPLKVVRRNAKVRSRGLAQATRKQGNNNNANQPPNRANTSSPTAYGASGLGAPAMPAAPPSPSLSTTMTSNDQAHQNNQQQKKIPLFFREDYAGFIVKGNFMTLAARPVLVEEGEWLSHQIVEQNRILSGMLKCMQEKDRTTGRPTCNEQACPTMSAGSTTYTWIDTKGQPINLPAPTYIKHIQTWVAGKIQDQSLFPTDNFTTAPPLPRLNDTTNANDPNHWLGKTSGFPQRFEVEIKNMYKQMFRCYAHLYWQHWLTFWDLNAHRELNTCFVHFINVGRIFNLLNEKDMEPMAGLVDLWVNSGVLPKRVNPTDVVQPASAGGSAPSSAGGAGPATPGSAGASAGNVGFEKSTG
ncbi:uncharacterized protein LTR77_006577 [Saxophila tyrrhenica]|uniref:Mob1/phocein n=1 Tax=Saxophila tyrrhenica TaxID=1690608 RepID=A0AAV9P858_9PEZI|nr:hypothetical protein LTR77_006577 [Saxophila tyrrhenica]